MDHLFHPWHYAPLILAMPFAPMLWYKVRRWWRGEEEDVED